MSVNILKLSYLSDKKDKLIPIVLFIFAVIFLSVFLISTPTNGDTYAYAYSVQYLQGSSIHPGYYYIGHMIYFLTKFFSLSPLFALSLLSLISSALAIVLLYLFVFKISQNILLGLISSIILLFSGGFWFYSVYGEVYVPQLAFVLLSLFFIYYQKPLISSLFLLVAISITPTSALVLPALFFIMYRNKVDKKQLLYFIIPLMVPLIAVFLLKFSKLGDLYELAVYSPRIFFQNFSLVSLFEKVIMDLLFVYGKSYGILNFAAIFGVVLIFRENRNLFWILFLLIIPFTIYIFNLGLLTEDHLIITFIPMSVFSAYALFKAFFYFKKSKVLVTISILILLFSQILLSSQIFIVPEKKRSAILESTLQEFSGKFGPEAILISDWNFGMPFWYLTQNETSYSLLTGRPVRFFQKDCIDKEQCLQRLTQSFWIDIPNLRIFLAEEELKDSSFSKEREIFFVNPKSQSNWFKQLFVGKESTRDPAEPGNRKVRFINLMQKSLEMHLHIADSMDYPLEKIYKFRVMPAGR